MTRTELRTFAVTPTGVGRTDYSQDVQKSVEPLPFNWQDSYSDFVPFHLGVGDTATIDIIIETDMMLLLYDFYLSCFPSSDMSLFVQYYNPLTQLWVNMIAKTATQNIDLHFAKGFPFIGSYRFIATNLGAAPIDCFYTTQGIIMEQSQIFETTQQAVTTLFTVVP